MVKPLLLLSDGNLCMTNISTTLTENGTKQVLGYTYRICNTQGKSEIGKIIELN